LFVVVTVAVAVAGNNWELEEAAGAGLRGEQAGVAATRDWYVLDTG